MPHGNSAYIKLLHLLFKSSGNLIEYSQLSKLSGLSRPTVSTYLESLKVTHTVSLLPPFHDSGKREITQRPKSYAFDTGLMTYVSGWNQIREEDRGVLWEHLALDMLQAHYPGRQIYYWRDKSNREIDFVLPGEGKDIDIFECKINPNHLSPYPISVFRSIYPAGRNICFCPFIKENYTMTFKELKIEFIGRLHTR